MTEKTRHKKRRHFCFVLQDSEFKGMNERKRDGFMVYGMTRANSLVIGVFAIAFSTFFFKHELKYYKKSHAAIIIVKYEFQHLNVSTNATTVENELYIEPMFLPQ